MRAIACSTLVAVLSFGALTRADADEGSRPAQAEAAEQTRESASGSKGERLGPAEEERHTGGFLRIDALGLGFVSVAYLTEDGDASFSGVGEAAGIHLGRAAARGMILGIHLYGAGVVDPTVRAAGATRDATFVLLGAGPELTFYLMPSNLYVTSSVLLTQMRVDVDGTPGSSQAGFGAYLALGKEWWMSAKWGLGFAAHLAFSTNKDESDAARTLRATSVRLGISATYN